jgi:hypothetical protein
MSEQPLRLGRRPDNSLDEEELKRRDAERADHEAKFKVGERVSAIGFFGDEHDESRRVHGTYFGPGDWVACRIRHEWGTALVWISSLRHEP